MKTRLKLLAALFLTVIFIYPLNAQVKSDFKKGTDFTKYKTYSFEGWQEGTDVKLNDFDKKRIIDALRAELDERGLEYTEGNSDASFALFVNIETNTNTTAYTNYTNYMGGMGYNLGWGWGMGPGWMGPNMGSATTTYSQEDYNEGTLVVDMFDNSSKELIWQGVLTKVVNEKPDKRDKTVPRAIGKLMKQFPVQAR